MTKGSQLPSSPWQHREGKGQEHGDAEADSEADSPRKYRGGRGPPNLVTHPHIEPDGDQRRDQETKGRAREANDDEPFLFLGRPDRHRVKHILTEPNYREGNHYHADQPAG